MAVNLSPIGGVAAQFLDNSGNPLTGGKIFTYAAGTTTPQSTYTSANGVTPHANPIILDAAGRVPGGEIWLTDGLQYKFLIKTSTDVQIGSYDNIIGINSNFVNYTNSQEIQTATSGQTVFTLTTMAYQPGTNSLSVFVDGVNQYGPGAMYAYQETSDTVVTFNSGLHVGAEVKFTTSAINASSYGDAEQISYTPPFTGSVATNVELKLAQTVSVKDFGAVGDGVADDTAAIQAGVNYVLSVGAVLFFPAGTYKITDTISLLNANYVKSAGMQGENGNSTRIYFYNSTSLKDMFYVDSDVNYLEISDLEFIDNTARTSRGFYFFDTTASGPPAWKHLFRNVRITQFKEGVRFDGGATPALDAHCSEVMFIHSKTRNCETGLIYNNTQAVNHQLIGFDMENDAEGVGDAWTHIKLERGTTINHFGGSVIGKGSYLSYTYSVAGGFQDTSQFMSKGVRVEMRGGAVPLINHDTTSTITLSNSLRIVVEDMPVNTGGSTVFARFGGRTFAKFSNVHASTQLDVEAYMTSNLSANGEIGAVVMADCQALNYKRVSSTAAYGGTGVLSTNYRAIPAQISYQNEGAQTSVDGGGYTLLSTPTQTIYAGGWQSSAIKTLVLANSDSGGFGAGSNPATGRITLPLYGRPIKFRILRDAFTTGSPFVFTLVFVVSGVDYTVATITPGSTNYGHFEANISLPTVMTQAINDGVVWDGRMKFVKSGSVTGFTGLAMIDYM